LKLRVRGPRPATPGALPATPRFRNVFALASEAARQLGHDFVGTEHLLLGLLRESEGVGAQVLMERGVTLDRAERTLHRLLGTPRPASPPAALSQAESLAAGGPPAKVPEISPRDRKLRALRFFILCLVIVWPILFFGVRRVARPRARARVAWMLALPFSALFAWRCDAALHSAGARRRQLRNPEQLFGQ
jgi:hypothetical protein